MRVDEDSSEKIMNIAARAVAGESCSDNKELEYAEDFDEFERDQETEHDNFKTKSDEGILGDLRSSNEGEPQHAYLEDERE